MSSETAVDSATWRLIVLRGEVYNDDGTRFGSVDVSTLQPPEWIIEERAEIGAHVHFPLDLVELGLSEDLAATVMAIEPCRTVQSGPGRVVLTTVSSPSNLVMELSLRHTDGRTQTIRPTAGHRFYSEYRQQWLPAGRVQIGEELRGMTGPITVVSSQHLPGVHRVYNMTVETDHRYHVSNLGILSHNDGPCPPKDYFPGLPGSGPTVTPPVTPPGNLPKGSMPPLGPSVGGTQEPGTAPMGGVWPPPQFIGPGGPYPPGTGTTWNRFPPGASGPRTGDPIPPQWPPPPGTGWDGGYDPRPRHPDAPPSNN